MVIKELIAATNTGALTVVRSESGAVKVGGLALSEEQLINVVHGLGWSEFVLPPDKLIEKTAKFAKGVGKYIKDEYVLDHLEIGFQNIRSNEYGKTYDRIHFVLSYKFEGSIIYNMKGGSSTYEIYDSRTSLRVEKGSSLKKVGEFLNSLGGRW